MRIKWKYFFLFIFLAGCKNNTDQTVEKDLPLFSEPLTVPLNLSGGYAVNLLTGDSILPLINSLGDTVQTGISQSLKASAADAKKISKPNIIQVVIQSKELKRTNIHRVEEKLKIISGDTVDLQDIQEIINPGTIINATGQTKPMHEPQPVKTFALRFRDGATSNIQYLEIGQGLSYSFVPSILIDRNGYLWFGVDGNGLCKYDGISITNYTQKEGLPNNNVLSLVEDKRGNIWIVTDGGLCVFDGKNITQYTKKNGFSGNTISSVHKDKKENIWIIGSEISGIRFDGKNFIQFANGSKFSEEILNPFFEDSHGSLWYKTKSGIGKFEGKKFINYPIRKNKKDTSNYKMIEDSNANIWVASVLEGIYRYDGKNFIQYFDKEGLSGNVITSFIVDKNANIWIGTRYAGIIKFDGINFTTYSIEEGLTNNSITQMVEDNAGSIWCSTEGGGIIKLDDDSFKEIIKMEDFGNSRVRPIMKDWEENLWFGTEAGIIYKYDRKSIKTYKSKVALPSQGLRSILADKKGNLWFGYTDNGGLLKYDGKQFLHFTASSGIRGNNIMSILEDRNGVLWLGTYSGGINRLEGDAITYYSEKEKFSSKNVYTILEDKKGNLWFGTNGGAVVKYDGKNFITFSEKEGFFGRAVTSIVEDEVGNLWFGTLGAGLCKFDGKSFTYFTEKQGLSYNDVWSLKEDATGQFWAGTDKGLSLLIPSKDSLQHLKNSYSIYSFGLQDGLKGTDFNLHSVCIDNNSRIWWGNGKNVTTFDLNNIFQPNSLRSLSLNYLKINDGFYDFRNLPDSIHKKISYSYVAPFSNLPQKLVLSFDQNHLSFNFSAIDWSAPGKIKYSYRLIGVDNNWSSPSVDPQTAYRNLSHGTYQFQVKAIGRSQVWTKPLTYDFVIRPAWWQTWWIKTLAIMLSSLLLLFIAKLFYLSRLRKQRVLMEKQLAVQYERQRISSEMHDDIGAGLSGVRLLTEMAKTKTQDPQSISEIEKIYQSVGDVSARMKEVIWSLNTENDSLSNLIGYLQKQARLMLENYSCNFNSTVPDKIPEIKINGEVRRHIYLAVKEALHNIIKHSGANEVKLNITCNDKLLITVSDNGKGMNPDENIQGGNGLKNMNKRLKQINGELIIKNGNGLSLTFEIPLN